MRLGRHLVHAFETLGKYTNSDDRRRKACSPPSVVTFATMR